MGYFSNGEEGRRFEAKFCEHCVHNAEDAYCPVMLLHELWDYEQIEDDEVSKTKKAALDSLIENREGGEQVCLMFHERTP